METLSDRQSAVITPNVRFISYAIIGLCFIATSHSYSLNIQIEDKYVQVNETAPLKCVIDGYNDKENFNSSDFDIFLGGEPQKSTTINEWTKEIFISANNPTSRVYYCKSTKGNSISDRKKIYFGIKPFDITNFHCISMNMNNLKCSWAHPFNVVEENFQLYYIANGMNSKRCNIKTVKRNEFCYWDKRTDPPYRGELDEYEFVLEWNNKFGNNVQRFIINHDSLVKLDYPYDLIAESIKSHEVILTWNLPNISNHFNTHFVMYKIDYKMPKYNETVYNVDTTGFLTTLKRGMVNKGTYKLKGLPYAHTEYHVRIFVKTTVASEEYWSEPGLVKFTSASEIPRRPPEVPTGAFCKNDFTDQRFIYVYWKQLREFEEAGDHFTYIYDVIGKDIHFNGSARNMPFVKLENISSEALYVSIRAANKVGWSLSNSTLYIPSFKDTGILVTSFTSYAHNNGTYELSWKTSETVDNYTLFWCERETSKICNSRMEYKPIAYDVNKYLIDMPKNPPYQFAISANKGAKSSGMTWTKCELTHDGLVMNEFPINFDYDKVCNSSVKLAWSLNCIFTYGIVTGYNITYYPVNQLSNASFVYIDDIKENRAIIRGLLSYTLYTFKIKVNTIHGLKSGNNSITVLTAEGSPESPQKVKVLSVKNNSITMDIERPRFLNGPPSNVMYVFYNYYKEIARVKLSNQVILNNLNGFQHYSLTVKTYNQNINSYSKATEQVLVRTKIGIPSKIKVLKYENFVISWNFPDVPNGKVDFYQIKIVKDGRFGSDEVIINSTDLNYYIEMCTAGEKNTTYQVRAINLDLSTNDVIEYPGEWSTEILTYCNVLSTRQILFTILGIFIFVPMAYLISKCYIKRKTMADLGPPIFHPDLQKSFVVLEYKTAKLIVDGSSQSGKQTAKYINDNNITDPLLVTNNNINHSNLNRTDYGNNEEKTKQYEKFKKVMPNDKKTWECPPISKNALIQSKNHPKEYVKIGINNNMPIDFCKEPTLNNFTNFSNSVMPKTTISKAIERILPLDYVQVSLPSNTCLKLNSQPPVVQGSFRSTPSGYVLADISKSINVTSVNTTKPVIKLGGIKAEYIQSPNICKRDTTKTMSPGYVQASILSPIATLPSNPRTSAETISPRYTQQTADRQCQSTVLGNPDALKNIVNGYVQPIQVSDRLPMKEASTFRTENMASKLTQIPSTIPNPTMPIKPTLGSDYVRLGIASNALDRDLTQLTPKEPSELKLSQISASPSPGYVLCSLPSDNGSSTNSIINKSSGYVQANTLF